MIRDRLLREAEGNVAAARHRGLRQGFPWKSRAAANWQLAILIETMRREGFELSVSRPRVVLKKDDATGQWQEPIEKS